MRKAKAEIRLNIRTVYSEPSLSDTIACINGYQINKWRYPGNTIITKHNLPEAPKEEIRKNNENEKKNKHRLSHQNTKKKCNRGTALGRSVGKRLCGLNQFYSRETSPLIYAALNHKYIFGMHWVLYLLCETSQWNVIKTLQWNKTKVSMTMLSQNTKKSQTGLRWSLPQTLTNKPYFSGSDWIICRSAFQEKKTSLYVLV